MLAISTEDIGLVAAEMRRELRDMRLVVIEDWEERTEATEAGEIDRDGVEISELEEVVLLAYDAMACASERRGEGKGETI